MTAQNFTFRLSDEIRAWLDRNGQPKAQQLRRDLETLQLLAKIAAREKKAKGQALLRDIAEDFGLI